MRGIHKTSVIFLALFLLGTGSAHPFRRGGDGERITEKIQEAKSQMADEHYDDALKILKSVVKDYPRNPKTEIALATINHIYQIIDYMDEAFEYFIQVEKENEGHRIAMVAAYLYIPILIKRQLYDLAIAKCEEVYRQDPESYWAIGSLFNMASLYCRTLQREDEGIAIYKKIIKRYPNSQFAKIARMEIGMLHK